MKSKAIVYAIAAATLSLSTLSFAQGQGYGHGNGRGPGKDGPRFDQRGPGKDGPRFDQRGPGHDARPYGNARNDRDHGRRLELRRGGHIPKDYRTRQYVVNDWRAHRLNPPARGQPWVQVGTDYALIAIATGLIANVIINGNGYHYGYAPNARGAVADPGM